MLKTKKRKNTRTTKDERVILSGTDYTRLRMQAYERSIGMCECGCGRRAPWPDGGRPPMPWEGHLHHKNGRGMGSGKRNDVLGQVAWIRGDCHWKEHNPKVVPPKPRVEE